MPRSPKGRAAARGLDAHLSHVPIRLAKTPERKGAQRGQH
jgi:hypothetical protein